MSTRQAFDAMTDFLTAYWEKTSCDEVSNLLSDMDMRTWGDGNQTADPAIWGEWIDSINAVLKIEKESKLTVLQAFQAMIKFLEQYIPFNTPEDHVIALMNGIQILSDGSLVNQAFWKDWINSVNKVLKQEL